MLADFLSNGILSLVEYDKLGLEELAEVRMKALELEKSAWEKSKDVYSQTSRHWNN
jgi:hypothetical protein